jgi:hypothetical protein
VVEQVGGALGHAAAAATRTERASLTRKRDEPVEATVAAAKSREPAGKPATLQKVPELLLDELGQTFAVSQMRGLQAELLEVIAHDLMKRGLRRTPRFVSRRGRGHSDTGRRARASERSGDSGPNR